MSDIEPATRAGMALRMALCLAILGGGGWAVRSFRWDIVWRSAPFLLRGLAVSWELAIISILIGLAAGCVLAAARLYGKGGVRQAAVAYIELIRSIPQLLIIFWIYFSVPSLTGAALDSWLAALIALSIIASAYLAEVVRAGLMSVSRVHLNSAYASGLGSVDTFLGIVLPQALRNMLPALVAHIVMMFKLTSLVYLIGLVDFFRAATLVNSRDYAPYALYLTMALGYVLCSFLLATLVRRFDPKYTLSV